MQARKDGLRESGCMEGSKGGRKEGKQEGKKGKSMYIHVVVPKIVKTEHASVGLLVLFLQCLLPSPVSHRPPQSKSVTHTHTHTKKKRNRKNA